MCVIIGGGPAGLYTAIKLKMAGVDVVVYDPRADDYTRPGHLHEIVFIQVKDSIPGLNIGPERSYYTVGHIKDLEKQLYSRAKELGVRIEKKRFVGFHHDRKKPGIVVADEHGTTVVHTDYVFDCTGSRREVVHEANRVSPGAPPFKLKSITDVPVPTHFFAYVNMSRREFESLKAAADPKHLFPPGISSEAYARCIIKLRALGWNELKFPRCLLAEFGKDKVGLYLHAPKDLAKENYDQWVKTVLECYTSAMPISYSQRPASIKHPSKSKLRYTTFPVTADALEQFSCKIEGLPNIIALGDAQIDPVYSLGHGISNGMVRIDVLLDSLERTRGVISKFNSAKYFSAINPKLNDHKMQMVKEAEGVKSSFYSVLEPAKVKLAEALSLISDEREKKLIRDILSASAAAVSVPTSTSTPAASRAAPIPDSAAVPTGGGTGLQISGIFKATDVSKRAVAVSPKPKCCTML